MVPGEDRSRIQELQQLSQAFALPPQAVSLPVSRHVVAVGGGVRPGQVRPRGKRTKRAMAGVALAVEFMRLLP